MGFDTVWGRVQKVTGWKRYSELARCLEFQPPSVTAAKNRDAFPIEWAHKVAMKFNSTTEWLMEGVGTQQDGRMTRSVAGQEKKEDKLLLDEHTLASVIEAVERYQSQQKLNIQPGKKAELVLALYEMFLDEEVVDVASIGRLVKLASNQ